MIKYLFVLFCCVNLILFFSACKIVQGRPLNNEKNQTITTFPQQDTVRVYILQGQSNMAGRISVKRNLNGELEYLSKPLESNGNKVYIRSWWTSSAGRFVPLAAGVNSSDGDNNDRFGIQPFLGKRLLEHKNENIYFFQAAQSGRNIINWTQSVRDLYKFCDTALPSIRRHFEEQGKVVKFVASIWIQGEANGGSDTEGYKKWLDSLLVLNRKWTGTPDLPFLLVQMMDCQRGVKLLPELQECQQRWAIDNSINNVFFFGKNDGPDDCQDPLHFGIKKIDDLATKIFELVRDW